MGKPEPKTPAEAAEAIEKAAKEWRSAKKRERAARDALARVVSDSVSRGLMNENKIVRLTDIPRMTIRKMLGKS